MYTNRDKKASKVAFGSTAENHRQAEVAVIGGQAGSGQVRTFQPSSFAILHSGTMELGSPRRSKNDSLSHSIKSSASKYTRNFIAWPIIGNEKVSIIQLGANTAIPIEQLNPLIVGGRKSLQGVRI